MGNTLLLFMVVGFVAVVLAFEGAYLLWNDNKSPEVQRLARRLRTLSAGEHGRGTAELLKRRHAQEGSALEKLLMSLPRVSLLDRMIEQSGVQITLSRLLLLMAGLGVGMLLLAQMFGAPWLFTLVFSGLAAALPALWLSGRRTARLRQLESQLPDVIDLLARAMRSGHSFPSALQMASEESPEPIATEFRIVHDEINFGVSQSDAFRNLSARVPSDDLRFFVIAVLLQRETGGNLSEVLGNIARLIRNRFRLLGKVRVLAAEGKLSGWVLALLPVGTGLVMYMTNPAYISLLWTDPAGISLIYTCLVLFALGVLWMWRIIKIRV